MVTIDEERFDSEIMENWEIRLENRLGTRRRAAVQRRVLFYQDYSDKQIGTQILVPTADGGIQSNPRITNASSAEVWGLELEAIWQPNFMEGLVLQGGYTFLDTQYTDYVDVTTTAYRAAANASCPIDMVRTAMTRTIPWRRGRPTRIWMKSCITWTTVSILTILAP